MQGLFACVVALSILDSSTSLPDVRLQGLLKQATDIQPWMLGIRRHLHQWPETMYNEHNTSAYLRKQLDDLGISYQYPYAETGIVATLGKGSPVVGLRADMDALPIQEQTGLSFASKVPGKSHACGHDAHMTMLLGGAKLLKGMEKDLKGTVKLFFQPAEEGGAGGKRMVEEGATKGIAAMFGFHVWPLLEAGAIGSRPGVFMAGAASFDVKVMGRGGHAAMPHVSKDPIVATVAIITALQTLVSRETSPLDSAVISITKLAAGEGANNVIPDSATFGGTLRALSKEQIFALKQRISEVLDAQAASHRCTAEIDWHEDWHPIYLPTVNDKEAFQFTQDVAERMLGNSERILEIEPTMAGEDFAFYGDAGIPAAYMFLGIRDEGKGTVHGLHTARFLLDEDVLPLGAAYHAALASYFVEKQSSSGANEEL